MALIAHDFVTRRTRMCSLPPLPVAHWCSDTWSQGEGGPRPAKKHENLAHKPGPVNCLALEPSAWLGCRRASLSSCSSRCVTADVQSTASTNALASKRSCRTHERMKAYPAVTLRECYDAIAQNSQSVAVRALGKRRRSRSWAGVDLPRLPRLPHPSRALPSPGTRRSVAISGAAHASERQQSAWHRFMVVCVLECASLLSAGSARWRREGKGSGCCHG